MDVDGRNFRKAIHGFGEILRELRCSRGLSQLRLARLVGVHHSYVSRLERGTRGPSPGLVQRLSEALQLDEHERSRLVEAAGYMVPREREKLAEIVSALRRVVQQLEELLAMNREVHDARA